MRKFTELWTRRMKGKFFFAVIFLVQLAIIIQVIKYSLIAGSIVAIVCCVMDTLLIAMHKEATSFLE